MNALSHLSPAAPPLSLLEIDELSAFVPEEVASPKLTVIRVPREQADLVDAARIEPAPAHDAAQSGTERFQSIVRWNLHAAAQHAALGHQAPSFRECPHASCRDASNLIAPIPETQYQGKTIR